jgi:hypothetical protein
MDLFVPAGAPRLISTAAENVSGRTDADLFGQVALSRMLVVLDSKRPEISAYSGG